MPDVSLKPLEEFFRARVITFLVDKGLLPPARSNKLRGWVHSGFNVHRSRRVQSAEREDLERLAQYIIRNPFAVESRAAGETGCPEGSNGAKRSGNMRGQRDKRAAEDAQAAGNAVAIIDASEHKPRRIPSASRPKGDGLPAGQQRSEAEWQLARVDQEGLGGRSSALPEVPERDAHRFSDRRQSRDRMYPAPPWALATARARCVGEGAA